MTTNSKPHPHSLSLQDLSPVSIIVPAKIVPPYGDWKKKVGITLFLPFALAIPNCNYIQPPLITYVKNETNIEIIAVKNETNIYDSKISSGTSR